MTNERTFSLDDPHASPHIDGAAYSVERRMFARIPCLVERPSLPVRALLVAYHGAGAAKEGKLGVYSALTAVGVAIIIPDAPLHGERSLSQPGLNHREFVWESARRSVAEAEAFFTVLNDEFGSKPNSKMPLFVVGSSMGGYVALTLARRDKIGTARMVYGAAALITSGVWEEPSVNAPGTRLFVEVQRPISHAEHFPPTPLLLLSGDSDPTFPLEQHHTPTTAALARAYESAGCPELFSAKIYQGVGHYTSSKMRDEVVAWVGALLEE